MNNYPSLIDPGVSVPPSGNNNYHKDVQEQEEDGFGEQQLSSNSTSSSSDSSSDEEAGAGSSSSSDDSTLEESTAPTTTSTMTVAQPTTTTAYHQKRSPATEIAVINGSTLQLPRLMCENGTIFYEFLAMTQNMVTNTPMWGHLQRFLPDFSSILEDQQECANETINTVRMLFNGTLTRFGHTPLVDMQRHLESGDFRPDVLRLRDAVAKSQRREQRFKQREHIGRLTKQLYLSRQELLSAATKTGSDPMDQKNVLKVRNNHRPPLDIVYDKLKTQVWARARKRFQAEMQQMMAKSGISKPLSADEEDDDAVTVEEMRRQEKTDRWATSCAASAIASSSYSVAERCVYGTNFKRRSNLNDDEAVRCDHYLKRERLSGRTLHRHLAEHKRCKLSGEMSRAEYDTTDIRLRDICGRSQMGADFKRQYLSGRPPLGRRPKTAKIAKTSNNNKLAVGVKPVPTIPTPSTLVSMGNQSEGDLHNGMLAAAQQQASQLTPSGTGSGQLVYDASGVSFDMLDGDDVELQQEEVETFEETTIPTFVIPQENVGETSKINEPLRNGGAIEETIKSVHENMHATVKSNNVDLMQSTHACFFSLLRDFFCSTANHRLHFKELNELVASWRCSPITALNSWYTSAGDWLGLLQPAIQYLTGQCEEDSKLPADFVPFIDYKPAPLDFYQWIGAGRDSDSRLTVLCEFWLQQQLQKHRRRQNQQKPRKPTQVLANDECLHRDVPPITVVTPPPPPPRCPTTWQVRALTTAEVMEFQRQELMRFEKPHRAFTYRMHGYESVVGPLKGIYSAPAPQTMNSKTKVSGPGSRSHNMMVADRPHFITILTLVRDATARLPNGEGTRADISELLKCSQYICRDAMAENVLQTLVSGALDRLHTELDACVRYDARRKIWIYLHRDRTEADFERAHHQAATGGDIASVPIVSVPVVSTTSVRGRKATASAGSGLPRKNAKSRISNASIQETTMTTQVTPPFMLPALVPVPAKAGIGAISTMQPIQIKAAVGGVGPPVPPLKYNIPTPSGVIAAAPPSPQQQQQQQKSLLRTGVTVQRPTLIQNTTNVVRPAAATQSGNVKQFHFTVPQLKASQMVVSSAGVHPINTTTPVLVTAGSPTGPRQAAASAVSMIGGKRMVAVGQQPLQQPLQQQAGFVVRPKLVVGGAGGKQTVASGGGGVLVLGSDSNSGGTITAMPMSTAAIPVAAGSPTKNFIRLVAPQQQQQQQQQALAGKPMKMQLVGQCNMIRATGLTQQQQQQQSQQQISSAGAVLRISSQALASLQQKQITNAQQQQTIGQQKFVKQQQGIVVGGSGVLASPTGSNSTLKNITVVQPNQISQQRMTVQSTSPVMVTTTPVKATIATSPGQQQQQQQRLLLQNIKQQQKQPQQLQQQQQSHIQYKTVQVVTGPSNGPKTVKTLPHGQVITMINNPNNSAGAKVVSLESLLQKQGGAVRVAGVLPGRNVGATSIPATTTTATNVTATGQRTMTVATSVGGGVARLMTTKAHIPATAAGGGAVRLINTVQGKQLILTNTSGTGLMGKQQSNANQNNTQVQQQPQMQTVIMGNQILRVQMPTTVGTTSSGIVGGQRGSGINLSGQGQVGQAVGVGSGSGSGTPAKNMINIGDVVATTTTATTGRATFQQQQRMPKTIVLGASGQTLRLQTSSNTSATNTTMATPTKLQSGVQQQKTAIGNRFVLAVQGGGQIFLPGSNTINLKALQNVKLMSLATTPTTSSVVSVVAGQQQQKIQSTVPQQQQQQK